jgi:hypothetical protein
MLDSRVAAVAEFVTSDLTSCAAAIVELDGDARSLREADTDMANDPWRTARLLRDEWRRQRYTRLIAS